LQAPSTFKTFESESAQFDLFLGDAYNYYLRTERRLCHDRI